MMEEFGHCYDDAPPNDRSNEEVCMEAGTGIEPTYKDLQSSA